MGCSTFCTLLAVFAVVAGEVRREVEGDEADPGAPVAGFNADDVLVLLGAGAEFDVVVGGDAGVVVGDDVDGRLPRNDWPGTR